MKIEEQLKQLVKGSVYHIMVKEKIHSDETLICENNFITVKLLGVGANFITVKFLGRGDSEIVFSKDGFFKELDPFIEISKIALILPYKADEFIFDLIKENKELEEKNSLYKEYGIQLEQLQSNIYNDTQERIAKTNRKIIKRKNKEIKKLEKTIVNLAQKI